MSKQFDYNFEKYSARDIREFLVNFGYKTDYLPNLPCGEPGFLALDLDLMVTLVDVELYKKKKSGNIYFYPRVYWIGIDKLYSERYYARESKDEKRIKEAEKKYKEYSEEKGKLFEQLKRKFALKKGEIPNSIKDYDWIKSLQEKRI